MKSTCDRERDTGALYSRRVPRRDFLAALAAAGVSVSLPDFKLAAQTKAAAASAPFRVDVHYHFSSPGFIAAIKARNTGQAALMQWTPEKALEDMDKDGVATSMVSTSEPSVWFGDNDAARKLARECNEYGARLMADHPGRFGMFATLPLPDVDGTLREIEYAFDTLKADGIGLLTSYKDKYLGDPSFAPVYDELNRRKAVVYVHPTTPDCCRGLVPGIPPGSIEYATDSTRTIAHVVFSGTAMKFPDIRWIFSHSGGTLPFLTGRFIRLAAERKNPQLPNGPMPEFRKFYYELAQGNTPGQIAALLKMVPVAQVMYGTDYPFRPGAEVNEGIAAYGFSAADIAAIERDNALKLLPRLKAS